MKRDFFALSLLGFALLCMVGCDQNFISDKSVRAEIQQELSLRQEKFEQGGVWEIFNQKLSTKERQALEFLYASMPSADLGDYSGEFFLSNVRTSLKAQKEMAWGKDIPEDIFRHFVLPVRVNNERMDHFRMLYYDTLKRRVEGLSLHDAALEINHWCHEKATYIPSDARTSSPLATMLTAEGRCGEESTFTVSAMRAVGIPARQVYTPRWAHTDSNHAWVEVWIDGEWKFLGACEPEPELNVAWFNQPATRALLMHTRVRGDYQGPEDVIQRTNCFTEINVINNYAPTRRSTVTVIDQDGKAVEGALVEYKIFNYGEFYSVVKLQSDAKGQASIHSGLGDMLVWASHKGKFGFGKLSGENLTIKLQYSDGDVFSFSEDVTPPPTGDIPIKLTDEQVAQNKVRLAHEDSLRMAYTATFMTAEKCADYTPREQRLLIEAHGNWRKIKEFIDSNKGSERERALALLENISAKDLHDTSLEVLNDALSSTQKGELSETYCRYILSPRIANEFLQPYRNEIRTTLGKDIGKEPSATQIIEWCKTNIALCDEYNPIALQSTPAGVLRLRAADSASRDRFFVAACRAFHIAARLNARDQRPEYLNGSEWVKVEIGGKVAEKITDKGRLKIRYDSRRVPTIPSPKYASHYTISRIEDGVCQTIRFDKDLSVDMGGGSSDLLSGTIELDEGYYMLSTGNRMANGSILSQNKSFTIEKGKECVIDLEIRPADDQIGVIGSMDAEMKYLPEGESSERSLLSTTGRGYFLVAVMGTTDEPTNHAMRGLGAISSELNAWARPVVILSSSKEDMAKLNREPIGAIKPHYGIDSDKKVGQMLCNGCNSTSDRLPIIAICDTFGRVVYFSQGYNTSLSEQLKYVIHKL
ncbi:MAG: transglutaminase domain-containing protein [Alistipes sp.]|nr:transglutaminase domain-containing protein [Alistipes sp.]